MQALGMIEVYGYLAAVEALDSALKAANVSRDRKSTRLNSSHLKLSRMPSSA